MRLTLRTLMAWMDDTLPPRDVRRIGRQLEHSKFSQDLSQRIRRVVRQRRLSVPGMGSNQAVDANIVSAYLDNNLPAEATSTFESLCLNSDVHLAEVAAVHEILSVLDQPCTIAPETYATMYRIVKAPEARVRSERPLPPNSNGRAESGEPVDQAPATPQTVQPDQAWPEPPFARNIRRFVAASVLISLLLAFGGLALNQIVGPPVVGSIPGSVTGEPGEDVVPFETEQAALTEPPIRPGTDQAIDASKRAIAETPTAESPPADAPRPAADAAPDAKRPDENRKAPERAPQTTPAAPGSEPGPMPESKQSPESSKPAQPAGEVKLPAVSKDPGVAEIATIASSTILLTAPENGMTTKTWAIWKTDPAPPCLVRFAGADSPRFESGNLRYFVSPGTMVRLTADAPPQWLVGTVRLESTAAGEFRFRDESGRLIQVNYPADAKFTIECRQPEPTAKPGAAPTSGTVIRLIAQEGRLSAKLGRTALDVPERGTAKIRGGDMVLESAEAPATTPANGADDPSAALVTRMMRRYFESNRPLATALIDAESDDLTDVRDLAMKIALWADREDLVADVLIHAENPETRDPAIHAIRETTGDAEASTLRAITAIAEELMLDETEATLLDSLLRASANDDSLESKRQLVQALEHESRLIRHLALERLMRMSGRDSMGFDPDMSTPRGIEAWRAWIGTETQGPRP